MRVILEYLHQHSFILVHKKRKLLPGFILLSSEETYCCIFLTMWNRTFRESCWWSNRRARVMWIWMLHCWDWRKRSRDLVQWFVLNFQGVLWMKRTLFLLSLPFMKYNTHTSLEINHWCFLLWLCLYFGTRYVLWLAWNQIVGKTEMIMFITLPWKREGESSNHVEWITKVFYLDIKSGRFSDYGRLKN